MLIQKYKQALAIEIRDALLAAEKKSDYRNNDLLRDFDKNNPDQYAEHLIAEKDKLVRLDFHNDFMRDHPAIMLALNKYKCLVKLVENSDEDKESEPAKLNYSEFTVDVANDLTAKRGYFRSRKGEALVGKITAVLPPDQQLLILIDQYRAVLAEEIRQAVWGNSDLASHLSAYEDVSALIIADRFIRRYEADKVIDGQAGNHTGYKDLDTKYSKNPLSEKAMGAAKKYEALMTLRYVLTYDPSAASQEESITEISDRLFFESKTKTSNEGNGREITEQVSGNIKNTLTSKRGWFASKRGNEVADKMDAGLAAKRNAGLAPAARKRKKSGR